MTVVAERAGLSQQMVSYVEREMRIPSLDTLLRIGNALDLDTGELITRAEKICAEKKK
jgi:transcriptional regulator with XRE-family HTH domain